MDRVAAIRRIIPDCGLSTDIFSGFHSETEEDHQLSLSLMEECGCLLYTSDLFAARSCQLGAGCFRSHAQCQETVEGALCAESGLSLIHI